MGFGGLALRSLATSLYGVAFCCAIIVLGIYGYFMTMLHHNNLTIPNWVRTTTGLSGVTALYTLFGVLLTCFLGAKRGFAMIATFCNIVFFAIFVALVVLTRDGAHSCSGWVDTPVGSGNSGSDAPGISTFGAACRFNKVAFAVSIIGMGALLLAIPVQLALARHHDREKRRALAPPVEYSHTHAHTPGRGHFWNSRSRGVPAGAQGADEKHF